MGWKTLVIVGFSSAFVAGGLAALQAQQRVAVSAKEMIAACQQRAKVIDEMRPLQVESESLRQIIVNFGFEKTAAAQQALGEEAFRRAVTDESTTGRIIAANVGESGDWKDLAPNRNRDTFVKVLKWRLEERIKTIQAESGNPEALVSPSNLRWLQAASKGNRELERAVENLNRTPIASRLQFYSALSSYVGKGLTAWDVAYAAADAKAADAAWKYAGLVAGTLGGSAVGFLHTEITWAGKNVYDAVTGRLLEHDIERMSDMTGEQLKLFKKTTEQRAGVDKRIGDLRRKLLALPPCDSLQVRGADSSTPQSPDSTQLVTPPPQSPASEASKQPTGGGGGAKGYVILGVATGAGLTGAYLWEQYEKNKKDDEKCGPQPSISFDPLRQSRPSDAQLQALRAWCTCNGMGFGQGSSGFGCIR